MLFLTPTIINIGNNILRGKLFLKFPNTLRILFLSPPPACVMKGATDRCQWPVGTIGVIQPYWRIDLIGAKRMVKAFIPHYPFLNPTKTFENLTLVERFCHPGPLAVWASAWDRATSCEQMLQGNFYITLTGKTATKGTDFTRGEIIFP